MKVGAFFCHEVCYTKDYTNEEGQMTYTTTNSSGKTMYLVTLSSGATCYMTAKAHREYLARLKERGMATNKAS